jgi:hypothetical protein
MPGPGHEIVGASHSRDESVQLQRIMLQGGLANGSRECAPDDRLRDEAIHSFFARQWIASLALAMTVNAELL